MSEQRVSSADLQQGLTVATGQGHRLFLPAPVPRLRLVGMFFELDKCFLLPSAMHGVRELRTRYDAQPTANVLVVGHTDTSGDDNYNLTLSLERADAVGAYLKDDVAAWEAFYDDGKPEKKRWGLRETQLMLSALPEGGPPFYDGEVNGNDDAQHRAAVTAFQRSAGLQDDGIAGPVTRKQLITEYMALDDTSLPQSATLTTHGCGENFPEEQTGDGKQEADNRRVEIFFFEGPIDPPPAGKTSAKGASDYPGWLARVSQSIDVVLGGASSTARLRSRYALERFEAFAAMLEENEFLAWASFSYGVDVPLDAYRKLRDDLVNKRLQPPEIQLVAGGVDGKDAAYDNATQILGVSEEIALAAETEDEAKGELIVLLMHEFGHHVDYLLRNKYSQTGGDAQGEEGSFFAFAVTGMHHVDSDVVPFATLTREAEDVELALDIKKLHDAARAYLDDPGAQEDAKRGPVEFFGAGRGNNAQFPESSFGHRSIEDGLIDADAQFFNTVVRDRIYFGNWLRDFSQFNDPAWLKYFQNRYLSAGVAAKELVTEVLDLGAHKDFEPTVKPSVHIAGFFHITTAKLGVYRPEEHIDNPQGLDDGRGADPLFHGPVSPAEIAIDPSTGMKAYIKTRGQGFVTASEFVEDSLRRASKQFSEEATRLFGQALHTLEDLFAHSNFVELALIRLGHTHVFPWVGSATKLVVLHNGKADSRFPMVTGMFGSSDMQVSMGSAIGESLQKPIECTAGEFTPASIAALKLIKAVTPDGGKAIESLFAKAHELEEKYPAYVTFMCNVTDSVRSWIRAKIGTGVRESAEKQAKQAEAFFKDPHSTAPTHSQLAKDHDDHPLHAIAAKCAKLMVADVGLAMRDVWFKQLPVDELIRRALVYMIHPNDIDLAVDSGPKRVFELIRAFADSNASVLPLLDLEHMKIRFSNETHSHASVQQQVDSAREMFADNDAIADRVEELSQVA